MIGTRRDSREEICGTQHLRIRKVETGSSCSMRVDILNRPNGYLVVSALAGLLAAPVGRCEGKADQAGSNVSQEQCCCQRAIPHPSHRSAHFEDATPSLPHVCWCCYQPQLPPSDPVNVTSLTSSASVPAVVRPGDSHLVVTQMRVAVTSQGGHRSLQSLLCVWRC